MNKTIQFFSFLVVLILATGCPSTDNSGPDSIENNSPDEISISVEVSGPKGNGTGYGISRQFTVQKNGSLKFSLAEGGASKEAQVLEYPSNGDLAINESEGNYAPKLNFTGTDRFKYGYTDEKGDRATVEVLVLVSPCFRNPSQFPTTGNIHIVAVNNPGPVTVSVAKQEEPVTLVLVGRHENDWKIQLEEGATLDEVQLHVPTDSSSQVVGISDNTPLTKIRPSSFPVVWEPSRQNADFPKYINWLRNQLEKNEASFQSCVQPKGDTTKFRIPYTAKSLSEFCARPSFYDFRNQNCEKKCEVENQASQTKWDIYTRSSSEIRLSPNELFVEMLGSRIRFGNILANRGHRCGKRYYELTVEELSPNISHNYMGIAAKEDWRMLIENGNAMTRIIEKGDLVGVAVDFDSGKVHFHIEENVTTVPIKEITYHTYYPAVQLSSYSSFTANFGQTPFALPIPEGYVAWDKE